MKGRYFVLIAVALPVAGLMLWKLAGRGPASVPVHLVPQPAQPRVTPEEAGIDPVALDAAAHYAGAHHTRALVVGRNGHIVYEKYWGGTTFESMVETGFDPLVAALVVGTALNDRLLRGLDEPLANYLPALAEPQKTYTLRELLGQGRPGVSVAESADLLAQLLESVAQQPWQTLVAQRLWSPLGGGDLEFRAGDSRVRPGGVRADCCLRARVGDWIKLGELLIDQGVYEANELMPRRYAALIVQPVRKDAPRGFFTRLDGTFADRIVWLEGPNGQRLWMVPALDLTVLRVGNSPSAGWDEALIPDSVIRGTRDWHPPAPRQEAVDPQRFAPH